MKIVKWADGTYSVRRWFLYYEYKDLRSYSYWWGKSSWYLSSCKGTLDKCQDFIKSQTIEEVIETKNIIKLRKYTGELKEELELLEEAKELERKANEMRKRFIQ